MKELLYIKYVDFWNIMTEKTTITKDMFLEYNDDTKLLLENNKK